MNLFKQFQALIPGADPLAGRYRHRNDGHQHHAGKPGGAW